MDKLIKAIIIVTIGIVLLIHSQAMAGDWKDRWLINGVKISDIKSDNIINMGSGMIISAITHTAGHYLAANCLGVGIHQEGVREILGNTNQANSNLIAWSGYGLQLGVGSLLNLISINKDFKFGYHGMSVIEVASAPILFGIDKANGDFQSDHGLPMYMIFQGWSVLNIINNN